MEYTLRGGVTFERRYDVRYLPAEVDRPGTAVNALKQLHSSPTIQYANLFRDVDRSRIIGGFLNYPRNPQRDEGGYLSWDWEGMEKLESILAELKDCIDQQGDMRACLHRLVPTFREPAQVNGAKAQIPAGGIRG